MTVDREKAIRIIGLLCAYEQKRIDAHGQSTLEMFKATMFDLLAGIDPSAEVVDRIVAMCEYRAVVLVVRAAAVLEPSFEQGWLSMMWNRFIADSPLQPTSARYAMGFSLGFFQEASSCPRKDLDQYNARVTDLAHRLAAVDMSSLSNDSQYGDWDEQIGQAIKSWVRRIDHFRPLVLKIAKVAEMAWKRQPMEMAMTGALDTVLGHMFHGYIGSLPSRGYLSFSALASLLKDR